MNKKDFIKIIKEEIQEFDFLGNDEYAKEMEIINLLKNPDFQKQFICDALLRKNNVNVKVEDNIISDDAGGAIFRTPHSLDIEINLNINYKYDQTKEPVDFSLSFNGENISISVDSDYDAGRWGATTDDAVAPSGGDWIDYVDWGSISVKLYTIDGDEIDFVAFEKAPEKIQTLFTREFCESNIEAKGDYSIELKDADKIQNVPYC